MQFQMVLIYTDISQQDGLNIGIFPVQLENKQAELQFCNKSVDIPKQFVKRFNKSFQWLSFEIFNRNRIIRSVWLSSWLILQYFLDGFEEPIEYREIYQCYIVGFDCN